jgi:pyridinium-3,5-bisthiocarboxylic acid mononucleotide nickel chelatase
LLVGTDAANRTAASSTSDTIVLLETNLDDATGEAIGHATELLWRAGALDVSTTPLAMKKNRPGVLLAVQCRPADAGPLAAIVFRETTALGLRRSTLERMTLPRRQIFVETPLGPIAGIVATLPDGSERFSPEYEACAKLASEQSLSLEALQNAARHAFIESKKT